MLLALSGKSSGRRASAVWIAVVSGLLVLPSMGSAQTGNQKPGPVPPPVVEAFQRVWQRADYPVQQGRVQRSWIWGPQANHTLQEPLAESPGGMRQVAYYDKSRMEVNDPNADPNSPWYVTNGLLVYEMMSGRVQVGMNQFEQREPAQVLVAGDPSSGGSPVNFTPTYATMARVATLNGSENEAPNRTGQQVMQMLGGDGTVSAGPPSGVGTLPRDAHFVSITGHNIPDVFWNFMNQHGLVYVNGQYRTDLLFDWVYTMGYPISEPYWVQTYVGNQRVSVMVQAFQRRILTYSPGNQPAWRVEMGNVGLQYYQWRYGSNTPQPAPTPNPPGNYGTQLASKEVPLPQIMQSRQQSGITQPLYAAISNASDFASLWQRHMQGFPIDANIAPPQVDFNQNFVVAAFWGNRPNGCYRENIQAVYLSGDTITVVVQQFTDQNSPEAGGPGIAACTQQIVQPYDIYQVARVGLTQSSYNVVFVSTDRQQLGSTTLTVH